MYGVIHAHNGWMDGWLIYTLCVVFMCVYRHRHRRRRRQFYTLLHIIHILFFRRVAPSLSHSLRPLYFIVLKRIYFNSTAAAAAASSFSFFFLRSRVFCIFFSRVCVLLFGSFIFLPLHLLRFIYIYS